MDTARRREDPLEVVTQIRSASIAIGAEGALPFDSPGGPLRAAHVRAARPELEMHGRRTFFAERWATQPVAARARVVWRGWAQSFASTLQWESSLGSEPTPRMRERLDELTALLSGPATRGELRVLESYEGYFQVLFTLAWGIVVRADPLGDVRRLSGPEQRSDALAAASEAWNELRAAWIAPWKGRRRHDELFTTLMHVVEPSGVGSQLSAPRTTPTEEPR